MDNGHHLLSGIYPNGSLMELLFQVFRAAGFAFEGVRRCGRFMLMDQRNQIKLGESVLTRPQVIPYLVGEGKYDIGICGQDCVRECATEGQVVEISTLPFSRSVFTREAVKIALVGYQSGQVSPQEIPEKGEEVLSEYPQLTREYFRRLGKSPKIVYSPGSTEAHIPRDFKYGVCLVETGATLRSLGLGIVDTIFESRTVLIANRRCFEDDAEAQRVRNFAFLLKEAASRLT